MITRAREHLLADGMPARETLVSALREHRGAAARMAGLRDAYEAKSDILSRRRRDGLPNVRIAHPYARYITSIASGYLLGQPVTYSVDGRNGTLEAIQALFRRFSEHAENVQLARDQSICGKGVEYVHVDQEGLPRVTALRPENAFVVYDDTCEGRPMFGVHYVPRVRADGRRDGWRIWVMSDSAVAEFEAASLDEPGQPVKVTPHYFGGVPLVEYWNDDGEKGDFEWVMPLIDAYDRLQSDRVNDKEQFVDRLLVLTGAVLETDAMGRKPMEQLREDHALQLPDSQARAEYLTSEMNEADVEVLRRALAEDIHKLSVVPDLSDERFAGNASGVAMRYKLLGFEQLIGVKERWFEEGLRTRLGLLTHYFALRGFEPLDVADIRVSFTRGMPANLKEAAEIVHLAREAGAASVETAVRLLHRGEGWTQDEVDGEAGRIRAESGEAGE